MLNVELHAAMAALGSVLASAADPASLTAMIALAGLIGIATLSVAGAVRRFGAGLDAKVRDEFTASRTEGSDPSELLSQSDPDADGHVRSRAPSTLVRVA